MTGTEAAPVAPVATANHDELTRSSTTALEGGLTTDGSVASAEEYLRPIKAAGKVPPPWLNAIARQASPLRAWLVEVRRHIYELRDERRQGG